MEYSLTKLPFDVLVKILGKIEAKEVYCGAARTCSLLHSVTQSNAFWVGQCQTVQRVRVVPLLPSIADYKTLFVKYYHANLVTQIGAANNRWRSYAKIRKYPFEGMNDDPAVKRAFITSYSSARATHDIDLRKLPAGFLEMHRALEVSFTFGGWSDEDFPFHAAIEFKAVSGAAVNVQITTMPRTRYCHGPPAWCTISKTIAIPDGDYHTARFRWKGKDSEEYSSMLAN
ncbi:hypothetical protein HK100_000460, partial [Physocladia obscura]